MSGSAQIIQVCFERGEKGMEDMLRVRLDPVAEKRTFVVFCVPV